MTIRDIKDRLISGKLIIFEAVTNPVVYSSEEGQEYGNLISDGTIKDEDILNREIKSIELVDDVYLLVVVYPRG